MVVYVDVISALIGASAESNTPVTNIHGFSYREVSSQPNSVVPILVANTINPVGFRQVHKWIEFSLTCRSEMAAALASYLKHGNNPHVAIPYFRVNIKNEAAGTVTFTFDGAFPCGVELAKEYEAEGMQTYKFIVGTMS